MIYAKHNLALATKRDEMFVTRRSASKKVLIPGKGGYFYPMENMKGQETKKAVQVNPHSFFQSKKSI